jgi:hypothetical protein
MDSEEWFVRCVICGFMGHLRYIQCFLLSVLVTGFINLCADNIGLHAGCEPYEVNCKRYGAEFWTEVINEHRKYG